MPKGVHKRTKEIRKKHSEALKKYYEGNPEARKKQSNALKKYYEENSKAKKRKSEQMKKSYEENPEIRKKQSEALKKYWKKPEAKKEHSESRKKYFKDNPGVIKGENSPNWKGGKSFEEYPIEFDKELKNQIRERDNHICQICTEKENGRALSVHHIDYNKKNNSTKNLISLCTICHMKTNGNREYWKEFFKVKKAG